MKIRQPWLIKSVAFAAAWVIRLWMGTLRYRYHPIGPNLDPGQPGFDGRYVYAFWHENILMPAYLYNGLDVWALVSQHADGELFAELCRHLRIRTVRGSSTRGGVQAVRNMLRIGRTGGLALTPDGPRGPRRQVQLGLIYLAAKTGLPIVPLGMAYQRAWRLHSWDRFAVPHPWTRGICVSLSPITVPAEADKDQMEEYRSLIEQAMLHATELAERLASAGAGGRASEVGADNVVTVSSQAPNARPANPGDCSCSRPR
jgi:lysophospholipid acyltransferase (LPLAT)-like uncharacterized protein